MVTIAELPTKISCEIFITLDLNAEKLPTIPETNIAKNELAKVYGTISILNTPLFKKK